MTQIIPLLVEKWVIKNAELDGEGEEQRGEPEYNELEKVVKEDEGVRDTKVALLWEGVE